MFAFWAAQNKRKSANFEIQPCISSVGFFYFQPLATNNKLNNSVASSIVIGRERA